MASSPVPPRSRAAASARPPARPASAGQALVRALPLALALLAAGLLAAAARQRPAVCGVPSATSVGLALGPWRQLGPFIPETGRGFSVAFGPEAGVNVERPCRGKRWERIELADGEVHNLSIPDNGSLYLAREIRTSSAREITCWLGSDDGLCVWLNGQPLLANDVPRGPGPDQDSVRLRLRAGSNTLLLKVYNISGGSGVYFSLSPSAGGSAAATPDDPVSRATGVNVPALERAIADLRASFGPRYPGGAAFASRLQTLKRLALSATPGGAAAAATALSALQREALLANPLLAFGKLLFVRRSEPNLGLPQNWQGNSSIPAYGYANSIATLSIATGAVTPVFQPAERAFVGDIEMDYSGDRFLFSMPGPNRRFQVFEMRTDGADLRQVTPGDHADVDNYSGVRLPDGRVVYCSTACYLGVPCVGGGDSVGSLYLLDEKTRAIRQLTFDQDHSWYPRVLNDGRVLYTRWEYSDTPHYFSRLLFAMNPDGTSQFEQYGSNSYWPNSLFYARPVPGHPSKLVAVVSGHHGLPRMGELVVLDPAVGRQEAAGVVQRIPGWGKPVHSPIADQLVQNSWPRFLHPYPLSEKYFLVSCQPAGRPWGIYLADVFDNLLCLAEEPGWALFEPTPIQARPAPPAIPDRIKPNMKTATVFVEDVYRGPGLRGVPRGTVKSLRVFANHYAYRGMGGHVNVGIDGPWDVKRILGTVPVRPDGSAFFRAPANLPLGVQPLDARGEAVQVMRSWYTAMPGEAASCVGCHEPQNAAPSTRARRAPRGQPSPIAPWYGAARGFSFEREVQAPVLQTYCVPCHNGAARAGQSIPDFRARRDVPAYGGAFTPAYEALHRYVRRPGNESDYRIPMAAEWRANTSELIQLLRKGHHGVRLPQEAWDRLVTWIDLNVPCHGTWGEQNGTAPVRNARMMELARQYGGPEIDHELIPAAAPTRPAVQPAEPPRRAATALRIPGWPFEAATARAKQAATGAARRDLKLGGGVTLRLAHIPAGVGVLGSPGGAVDERPHVARIPSSFWMGATEVTNAQFALFDRSHDNGVISMHNKDHDTRGYPMGHPTQPVVRVSWKRAMAFCAWLSRRTGLHVSLPTEDQWEWACRAGSASPFWFGGPDADFGPYANLSDRTMRAMAVQGLPPVPQANPNPLLDWMPRDDRFTDGVLITADVASYQPNPWGLYDMHGNAAEWTQTAWGSGLDAGRVVRGGSWADRPLRAAAGFRLAYPAWQGVYNVGFRVVVEDRQTTRR